MKVADIGFPSIVNSVGGAILEEAGDMLVFGVGYVLTTSGRRRRGRLYLIKMVWTGSKMVQFWHLETPFCSEVYGEVSSWHIPWSLRNLSQSFKRYSPLLSVQMVWITCPVSLSTYVNHSTITSNALALNFKSKPKATRIYHWWVWACRKFCQLI